MGCNPECYTKGRGCVVSSDGRCIFIFAKSGEPTLYKVKEGKSALKSLDEYVSNNASIKSARKTKI